MIGVAGLLAAFATAPADPQCARSDIVNMPPAAMLEKEDRFRSALADADRARLDAALPRAASGRIAECADRDGAACDAAAYLVAFRNTGMMAAFLQSICGKPPE
jgi:hypothetical protein